MSTAEKSNAPFNREIFRDLMVKHFGLEEVRDICFELKYDYENVPSGKNILIRELILQMEREGRIRQLIAKFEERRPAIPLDPIFTLSDKSANGDSRDVLIATQLQASDRQHAKTAEKSLKTIALLANNQAAIRELVIQFRTNFETTTGQIDQISSYKTLHDLFQDLETSYYLIYNDQKKVLEDDSVWDSIELLYELELRHKIDELLTLVNNNPDMADEARWTSRLQEAQEALQTAVSQFNTGRLKRGTSILHRIIGQQLSRINIRLVHTAELLQLEPLQSAMLTISQQIPPTEAKELTNGIDSLQTIQTRMAQLVAEHNAWQELDDELRLIDSGFTHGFEDLQLAWPDLVRLIQRICANRTEAWAVQILGIVEQLTHAIDDAIIVSAKRHFRRFRSTTGRRFRNADLELLALCTELQKVGNSLHSLLENA